MIPSFRGAPLGASPESILTIVVMDSGFALRAPRNDERGGPTREKAARRANHQFSVHPPNEKYFAFAVGQISATSSRHPAPLKEGRFAIVTNVGCGMRWTRWCARRARQCVRRSRVVLTPRRWCQVLGKLTLLGSDGGKKARSPGRATK
jgi:hypothetical protein